MTTIDKIIMGTAIVVSIAAVGVLILTITELIKLKRQ